MLARLLLISLCTATLVMLATWQPVHVHVVAPAPVVSPPAGLASTSPPRMSVVDVASGVPDIELASLVRLAPDERITAINDRPVDASLELDARVLIGSEAPRAGDYLDLAVSGPAGVRRVVMLVH